MFRYFNSNIFLNVTANFRCPFLYNKASESSHIYRFAIR